MPVFADLLRIHRRGDPAARLLDRRLDGPRARLPLSAWRRVRLRPCAGTARRGALFHAVALWRLARTKAVRGRGVGDWALAWTARVPGRRRRSGAPCALKAPLSPQRHADEGRHPRQVNVSALRPIGDSGLRRNDGEVGASMARAPPPRTPKAIRPRALLMRTCGRGFAGQDARGPDARGPEALSKCLVQKAPLSPQRHADEGRHPRQAQASTLRPIGDSGLRRNDGEAGGNGPRATSPDAEGDPGPRALLKHTHMRARFCGRGRPRSRCPRSRGLVEMPCPEDAHLPAASCRRRSASTTGKRFSPAAYRRFRPSPE